MYASIFINVSYAFQHSTNETEAIKLQNGKVRILEVIQVCSEESLMNRPNNSTLTEKLKELEASNAKLQRIISNQEKKMNKLIIIYRNNHKVMIRTNKKIQDYRKLEKKLNHTIRNMKIKHEVDLIKLNKLAKAKNDSEAFGLLLDRVLVPKTNFTIEMKRFASTIKIFL